MRKGTAQLKKRKNIMVTDETIHDELIALRQRVAELEQAAAHHTQTDMAQELRIFYTLVEHAPDAIAVAELEGTITYANPSYRTMYGYGDDIYGMSVLSLIAEEDQEHATEVIGESVTHGTLQTEVMAQRKDGTSFPIQGTSFIIRDENGMPQALASIQRDVTRLKQAEDQLRLAKFSLDRSADSMFWLEPNGQFIYANDSACSTLGYTYTELCTMHISVVAPKFSTEQWATYWDGSKRHTSRIIETHLCRKDGSIFPVEVTISDLEFNGKAYVCASARDITERKLAEEERIALQNSIIETQQDAIRELSSPLIPISAHVVLMPLIGSMDSARAQQVMETLLVGINKHHADTAIIDITGLSLVDMHIADILVQATQAARLLGARVMMTGIGPAMAQTLVHLGVDLSGIHTLSTLQEGIKQALR